MREGRIRRDVDQEEPKMVPATPKNMETSIRSTPNYHLVNQNTATAPQQGQNQGEVLANISKNDIIVRMTPGGLMIASEDLEALDVFERLLGQLAAPSASASDLPTIFWLKYAKADATAELVAAILGGAESSAASMTDSLIGGGVGGMLGGLMGIGGGGGGGDQSASKSVLTSTGSVLITSDNRLNALFVQANPIDLATVEMVLEKVDRMESPEDVELVSKPRLIPLVYQNAKDVSEVVKSVFGDRIAGAQSSNSRGGGGQQQQAAEFVAALRGGGGRGGRGGGGGNGGIQSEPTKINVSVDERSNSLIVTASEQDFEEVRVLAIALDDGGRTTADTVETVAIPGNMNAESVVEALEAVLGRKVNQTVEASGTSNATGRANGPGTNTTPSQGDIQSRIDAFRARAGAAGAGGFGGGRGGGGIGGRGGGGGGPGGRGGGGRGGGGR